jgi:hypothetical protein
MGVNVESEMPILGAHAPNYRISPRWGSSDRTTEDARHVPLLRAHALSYRISRRGGLSSGSHIHLQHVTPAATGPWSTLV